MNNRDIYKYHLKIGNKIVHRGITDDLDRREGEHQQKWPSGHIKQVGRRTTRDAALKWEREGGRSRFLLRALHRAFRRDRFGVLLAHAPIADRVKFGDQFFFAVAGIRCQFTDVVRGILAQDARDVATKMVE